MYEGKLKQKEFELIYNTQTNNNADRSKASI